MAKRVRKYSKEVMTPIMEKATTEGRFSLQHVDPEKHDFVQLGKVSIDAIEEVCGDGHKRVLYYSEEVVALDDFIVECEISERVGHEVSKALFYYRRYELGVGCYDLSGKPCAVKDAVVRLLYEAFWLDSETHDVIISMQMMRAIDEDGEPKVVVHVAKIRQDWVPRWFADADKRVNFGTFIQTLAFSLFAFTQNQVAECPEVFITKDKGEAPVSGTGSKRAAIYADKAKRRKTAVMRRIYSYNDAEEPSDRSESRKVQCPYYTVRGHWRKYKSGKVVWINSYAKGTERNNPEHIAPKDYIVEEKAR